MLWLEGETDGTSDFLSDVGELTKLLPLGLPLFISFSISAFASSVIIAEAVLVKSFMIDISPI